MKGKEDVTGRRPQHERLRSLETSKKDPVFLFSSKIGKCCFQAKKNNNNNKQNIKQNKIPRPENKTTPPNKSPTPKPKQNDTPQTNPRAKDKKRHCVFWQAGLLSWTFFKVFVPASGKF